MSKRIALLLILVTLTMVGGAAYQFLDPLSSAFSSASKSSAFSSASKKIAATPAPTPALPAAAVESSALVSNASAAEAALPAHMPAATPGATGTLAAGTLAAALPSGMRGVTVPADGVAGMSRGDRVDVLFTHGSPLMTEVLLTNIPVLTAVRPEADKMAQGFVTLEVDPTQAQKLALAEKAGSLALALRSAKDEADEHIEAPMHLDSLVHVAHSVHASVAHDSGRVRIIRGFSEDGATQSMNQ